MSEDLTIGAMLAWPVGRPHTRPYTEIGIRRVACIRCAAPARFQWGACADGNRWRPLCTACDVALNLLVLEWMGNPNAASLVLEYAAGKAEG